MSVLATILADPSEPHRPCGGHWTDLKGSSLVEALRDVAPRAHGNVLDVGCGDKGSRGHFSSLRRFVRRHRARGDVQPRQTRPCVQRRPTFLYDRKAAPLRKSVVRNRAFAPSARATPQPGELLSEMARVLSDDGLLIATVPFSFRPSRGTPRLLSLHPARHARAVPEGGAGGQKRLRRARGLWSVLGHKLNSDLGLHIQEFGGAGQSIGKLSHEQPESDGSRLWTLPVVAPTMTGLALWRGLLDRVLPGIRLRGSLDLPCWRGESVLGWRGRRSLYPLAHRRPSWKSTLRGRGRYEDVGAVVQTKSVSNGSPHIPRSTSKIPLRSRTP